MVESKGMSEWAREFLKWFTILVGEEMVRGFLPGYLPYALLVIAVYLTSEVLSTQRVRALARRVYLACPVKYRMLTYLAIFVVGGCLLTFYWRVVSRAATLLEQRPSITEKREKPDSINKPEQIGTTPSIAMPPSPSATRAPNEPQKKKRPTAAEKERQRIDRALRSQSPKPSP
jgi:hypothetical protein